jgi:hypothetical protein
VTSLPFAVITAAYLGVRLLTFGDRSPTYFQDSYSYLEVAKLKPALAWLPGRPARVHHAALLQAAGVG